MLRRSAASAVDTAERDGAQRERTLLCTGRARGWCPWRRKLAWLRDQRRERKCQYRDCRHTKHDRPLAVLGTPYEVGPRSVLEDLGWLDRIVDCAGALTPEVLCAGQWRPSDVRDKALRSVEPVAWEPNDVALARSTFRAFFVSGMPGFHSACRSNAASHGGDVLARR